MKTINLNRPENSRVQPSTMVRIFLLLVMMWPLAQRAIINLDVTAGYVDPSIIILILLSVICFTGFMGISWWTVKRFWMAAGLPSLNTMVSQFQLLEVWQQLGFYFASFALLLLAGIGCLAAIC